MTDPSAATPVAAPPSANEPMPPAQLATLVTATLGYYGLRDAVSTPWLRRAGQAVVLVGAVAPVVVGEFRSTPEETRRKSRRTSLKLRRPGVSSPSRSGCPMP